jgi:hypothetical protein
VWSLVTQGLLSGTTTPRGGLGEWDHRCEWQRIGSGRQS